MIGSIWRACIYFIYVFGVLHCFQQCTGHITTGRGNQYIQFVRVLYCKLPTNGKQLPAFLLKAVPGTEPRPQSWEARVLTTLPPWFPWQACSIRGIDRWLWRNSVPTSMNWLNVIKLSQAEDPYFGNGYVKSLAFKIYQKCLACQHMTFKKMVLTSTSWKLQIKEWVYFE